MYKTITTICVCGILAFAAAAPGGVQLYEDFATDPGWIELDNRTGGLNFGFSGTNNTGKGAGEAGGEFCSSGNGYYGVDVTSFEVGLFAATDTLHAEGYAVATATGAAGGPFIGWWAQDHYDESGHGTPAHFLGLEIYNDDGYLGFTNSYGNTPWSMLENAFTQGAPFAWSIDWVPTAEPAQGLLSATIGSVSVSQTITDPNALNAEFTIFVMYNGFYDNPNTATVYMDSLEYTASLVEPPFPGDADDSGTVDAVDAAILAENWLATGADWGMGDFNGDQVVDDKDATILATNWGWSAAAASVPEPSCLFLLIAAIVTALVPAVLRRI